MNSKNDEEKLTEDDCEEPSGSSHSRTPEFDDYDKSLEFRQLARWVIIAGLILFIASILVYVVFFVD
jgi:hypothetical protein